MNTAEIEWRPIAGWEGLYEVSNLGEVRSLGRTRIRLNRGRRQTVEYPPSLMRANDCFGYPTVRLRDGQRKEKIFIHRAVCEAWHGPPPEGCEAAHGDGSRTNNTPQNLRWATRQENMRDKIAHGTALGRDEQPQAKLSSRDFKDILERMDAGQRNCEIWRCYPQVTRGYISSIRSRHRPHSLDIKKRKKGLPSGST